MGISSKRQDNPDRSGTVPGGAGAIANSPRLIAASAQPRPPPENIAYDTSGDGAKRATRMSRPFARISATGTSATRMIEAEIVAHPGGGRGHRLARQRQIAGRHGEARTVAAEHERKLAMIERVGDGGDDRGAGHVDGLVALRGDRRGRLHDVGDADGPVIRQRNVQRRVHQPARSRETPERLRRTNPVARRCPSQHTIRTSGPVLTFASPGGNLICER